MNQMLTYQQYLELQLGDQVRLYKEVYTVTELTDVGSHIERTLVSSTGNVQRYAIYIAHLMSYHGKIDRLVPTSLSINAKTSYDDKVGHDDLSGLPPLDEEELKLWELDILI